MSGPVTGSGHLRPDTGEKGRQRMSGLRSVALRVWAP